MPRSLAILRCAAVALLTALLIMAAWSLPAHSHEWYDPACCSGEDCQRIPASAVQITPTGYVVTLPGGVHKMSIDGGRWSFGFTDRRIRVSQDGDYHICILPSSQYGQCFYAPPMSF